MMVFIPILLIFIQLPATISMFDDIKNGVKNCQLNRFRCELCVRQNMIEALFKKGNSQKNDAENQAAIKGKKPAFWNRCINKLKKGMNFIERTDPIMYKILWELIAIGIQAKDELSSGLNIDHLRNPLMRQLANTVTLLAKRHNIPKSEIEPLKEMNGEQLLQELSNVWFQQDELSETIDDQQNYHGQNNSREKRMLNLVMKIVDDDIVMSELPSNARRRRRRRRRRRSGEEQKADFFDWLLIACFVMLVVLIIWRGILDERQEALIQERRQRHRRRHLGRRLGRKFVRTYKKLSPTIFNEAQSADESCSSCKCECAICLDDIECGTIIRPLPACIHLYHEECIELWLLGGHHRCPYCRAKIFIVNGLRVRPNHQIRSDQTNIVSQSDNTEHNRSINSMDSPMDNQCDQDRLNNNHSSDHPNANP